MNFAEIFEPMKAAGRALTETARTLARLTAGLSEKSSTALADYADVVQRHTQHHDLAHAKEREDEERAAWHDVIDALDDDLP